MNIPRLRKLREVAQRLLDRRADDLGFDRWDCGTYACLLGHYAREIGYESVHVDIPFPEKYFGIDPLLRERLFGYDPSSDHCKPGPAALEELERRIALIDAQMSKHEGIPESVREIFKATEEVT